MRVPTRPSPSVGFRFPSRSYAFSSFSSLSSVFSFFRAPFRPLLTTATPLPPLDDFNCNIVWCDDVLCTCLWVSTAALTTTTRHSTFDAHPGQHRCVGDGYMDSTAPLRVICNYDNHTQHQPRHCCFSVLFEYVAACFVTAALVAAFIMFGIPFYSHTWFAPCLSCWQVLGGLGRVHGTCCSPFKQAFGAWPGKGCSQCGVMMFSEFRVAGCDTQFHEEAQSDIAYCSSDSADGYTEAETWVTYNSLQSSGGAGCGSGGAFSNYWLGVMCASLQK